jgi:hypothetical protein
MVLSNSEPNGKEYFVNCKDSVCDEEISLGLLDSMQLMNMAAFGLHCQRCHKRWIYDKNSIHTKEHGI